MAHEMWCGHEERSLPRQQGSLNKGTMLLGSAELQKKDRWGFRRPFSFGGCQSLLPPDKSPFCYLSASWSFGLLDVVSMTTALVGEMM